MIEFFVAGKPAPQGSKRAFANPKTGRVNVVESSKAVGPWREAIRSECQRAVSHAEASGAGRRIVAGEAAEVCVAFVLKRPAAHYGTGRNSQVLKESAPVRPANGPDSDKLLRATLDGLVAGGALADDRQVADPIVSKVYCDDEWCPVPGAFIRVRLADPVPAVVRWLQLTNPVAAERIS